MLSTSRSFKRPFELTVITDAPAHRTETARSPVAPTPSPLTPSSIRTTFSNPAFDEDLPISAFEYPRLGELSDQSAEEDHDSDESYGSDSGLADAQEQLNVSIAGSGSAVSADIEVRHMSLAHVALRFREVTGLEGRPQQIEAIHTVGCKRKSLILVAKTSFGKSWVFNMLPLLHPVHIGIVLVVIPLKHIASQQHDKINSIPRGKSLVYDKDHCSKSYRRQIAAGVYTHGQFDHDSMLIC